MLRGQRVRQILLHRLYVVKKERTSILSRKKTLQWDHQQRWWDCRTYYYRIKWLAPVYWKNETWAQHRGIVVQKQLSWDKLRGVSLFEILSQSHVLSGQSFPYLAYDGDWLLRVREVFFYALVSGQNYSILLLSCPSWMWALVSEHPSLGWHPQGV